MAIQMHAKAVLGATNGTCTYNMTSRPMPRRGDEGGRGHAHL